MKRIVLASASPRRKEILSLYYKNPEIIPADADERVPEGTPPDETVRILAARKARAVSGAVGDPDAIYIGSDTVVCARGEILGKPTDRADAKRMLSLLSGTVHEVWSGVCVIANGKETAAAECTRVYMRKVDQATVEKYVASGECDDKAGAYAIQGLAGVLVERIEGSYQNVVGLPVVTLDRLLGESTGEGLL